MRRYTRFMRTTLTYVGARGRDRPRQGERSLTRVRFSENTGISPSPLAGEGWGGGAECLTTDRSLPPQKNRRSPRVRPPTPTLPREGGGSKEKDNVPL